MNKKIFSTEVNHVEHILCVFISTIITAIFISYLIYTGPFSEINKYLKNSLGYNFHDGSIALSIDLVNLIGILFLIIIYYHTFSNFILYRGASYYIRNESKKIMKFIRSKKTILYACLVIIYLTLLNYSSKELYFKLAIIYSFLLIIFMIFQFLYSMFRYKKWRKFHYIFMISLIISILYNNSLPHSWWFVPTVQIYFFISLYLIFFFGQYFIPALLSEYDAAQNEKQLFINKYIIETISNKFKGYMKRTIKSEFNSQIYKCKFELHKLASFKSMLNSTILEEKTKESILTTFKNEILDRNQTSNILGNVILKRNKSNLHIAIVLLISTLVIELYFYETSYSHYGFIKYFRECLYILIFLRLMLRSTEIGLAFYYDLKSSKIKSSNLSSSKRITLAITSICEVVLLSSAMYFLQETELQIMNSYLEILYIFIEQIKYALSVAIFNASFPETHFKLSIIYNLSLNNVVHITQILLSIILISLSIANYSSKSSNNRSFKIIKSIDYIIIEYTFINGKYSEKEILRDFSLNELKIKLEDCWKDSTIDLETFNNIKSLIRFSILKE
ncbi:hypothetical protein [Exiguobacterium sp. s91]|uniref:hypothetical protein n=1 Tax=Exiguobacterium sp. s91 TaxID=2751199 RepID=UPI001BE8D66D|nr:hypothetical protein [Exiguobacterium sp. s91]